MAELLPLTVKNYTANIVHGIALKIYEEEWWNLTEMLDSMCSSASSVLLVDLFSSDRAVVLNLVKNCHFQLELCRAAKGFELE